MVFNNSTGEACNSMLGNSPGLHLKFLEDLTQAQQQARSDRLDGPDKP